MQLICSFKSNIVSNLRFLRFSHYRILWPLAAAGLLLGMQPCPLQAGAPTVVAQPAETNPTPSKEEGGKIVFPETSQTVSDIPGGEIAHYSFEVRNEGKQDLKILAVQPSCGCTLASFDPLIPAGGKGIIKASIQTQALWGKTEKHLSVYSSDSETPMVMLTLNAMVVPAVTITPSQLVTVPYEDVKPITQVFTIQSHRKDPMQIQSPPSTTGSVTAQVAPDPKNSDTYQVTVTVNPPASGGDTIGTVDLATSLSGVPPIQLTLVAVGQKGIIVSPATANMGIIGSPGAYHCTVSLFSRKSVFHITKVEPDDPFLKIQYTPQPANASWYNMTINYSGGWKKGIHQGSLTIYTDLPSVPTLKVPYWADVQ